MAIVAIMALSPGQVQAETETDADTEELVEVVCDGLSSLTMIVNTVTLQSMGELAKSTSSWSGECRMTVTLIDVSNDDNPADRTKSCTVTARPVATGSSIDIEELRVGDCETVETQVDVALPASMGAGPPSNGVSGQSARTAYGEMSGHEQFGIELFKSGVYVHYLLVADTGTVAAHTTWKAQRGRFSTYFTRDHRRYPGNSGTALYISNQWAKYVSTAGAYSSNNVIVTVTGQGSIRCRFSTIGFRGPNLLNHLHYHKKVCGTR